MTIKFLMPGSSIPSMPPAIGAFHDGKSVVTFCSKELNILAELQELDTQWWGWESPLCLLKGWKAQR